MYSALTNLEGGANAYPTARKPGGMPITQQQMEIDRIQATQELQRRREQQMEVSSGASSGRQTRSGATYSREAPMPPGLLNISCRLAECVFLGR